MKIASLFALGLLAALPGFAAVEEASVRQAINKLPYYGVFDDLSFELNADGTVTLTGQVAHPVVRRDAEAAVRRVAGVIQVDNKVEVLPVSYFDDRIRLRAYRALFGDPAFTRYALLSRSPIRILVKNGNVTLTGVVATEFDRTLAGLRMQGLGGTFAVTNQLRVSN